VLNNEGGLLERVSYIEQLFQTGQTFKNLPCLLYRPMHPLDQYFRLRITVSVLMPDLLLKEVDEVMK
jgi:hypothetical protein